MRHALVSNYRELVCNKTRIVLVASKPSETLPCKHASLLSPFCKFSLDQKNTYYFERHLIKYITYRNLRIWVLYKTLLETINFFLINFCYIPFYFTLLLSNIEQVFLTPSVRKICYHCVKHHTQFVQLLAQSS